VVKVIQVDEKGDEIAAIELDDFTVKTLHSGIAGLLSDAATNQPQIAPRFEHDGRARHARNKNRRRVRT